MFKGQPAHRLSPVAEAAAWEIAIRPEAASALIRKGCSRVWSLAAQNIEGSLA